MELQSQLYGLSVRKPVGQEATAVLENLTESFGLEHGLDYLKPILAEMKQAGVRNVILDLSQFPETSKNRWIAFLDGIATAYDFEIRYTGITVDEVDDITPSFTKHITPKIAESLDAAVESLSQQ